MTALGLWDSISKGSDAVRISEKQRFFLIDLARKEGLFLADNTMINFPDGMLVSIRNATHAVSGYGGIVASQITPGVYVARKKWLVRFIDTGNKEIAETHDLDRFTREGHKFEICKSYKQAHETNK